MSTALRLPRPVRHLLVDLDGTLLGNRAVSLSVEFVREAMGEMSRFGGWRKGAKTLIEIYRELNRVSRERTNDLRVVQLFSERMKMPAEDARTALREGVYRIFPKLERHFYPISGAREFLDWAKDRYTLTLATNPVWPAEIIELRVRWAGIDPKIFGDVTHVRRMHSCKPAVEYFEEILEQNKLKAEDCLLVGNEVKMDVPATRAGIPVYIVGDYKRPARITPPKSRVPAWRGSYASLKALLEAAPDSAQ